MKRLVKRRDFLETAASACALGIGGGLLPGVARGAPGAESTSFHRIAGPGAYALAPLETFVEENGLKAPPDPRTNPADFRFTLQEWRAFDDTGKVPGFSRPFGTLRILRRRVGDRTVYQLDRSESATRIRAKVMRENGLRGRLSWELTQTPRTPEGEALGLVTEVVGSAAEGRWERTVNGRRESGALEGPAVADCELFAGGLDLSALAETGTFTFFSHEACFQGQAPCALRREAPVTVSGGPTDLRLTPYGLTGAKHQPQHYLVADGRDYASAFTEFAVSMTLDSLA